MEAEVKHKILDQLYNDPSSPAAFAGINRLWEEVRKKHGDKISRKDIKHYLEGHRTYTLMRPKRVRFPRAKTVAAGFMTDCQVDLADLQALSRHNKGNRYLLVGIDVLSKRIFVTPLRTKRAEDMVEGFKQLFEQMPMVPHRIFSDKGTEFKNRPLKDLFEKEQIEKYESTHSSVKAALAERAIRQIKNRLYRYFAQNQTLNWIDAIQKIADGINHSPTRTHGMRPVDVTFDNAQEIRKRLYGEENNKLYSGKKQKVKYLPGQTVRMSVAKGLFEKGYIPNWGDEILEVDKVQKQMRPVRYKVRDEKGEKFKGFFYEQELAPVRRDSDTTYRIEKVFRKRKRADGTYEVLVKFIGYPEREWISETQLV